MSKYPKQYKIVLPVSPDDISDAAKAVTPRYIGAEIVTVVVRQPSGQNGLGIDDVVKRVPIVERLALDSKELIVSEAEKTMLLDLFKSFRFAVAGKEILDTYNAIVNAEDCTLGSVSV